MIGMPTITLRAKVFAAVTVLTAVIALAGVACSSGGGAPAPISKEGGVVVVEAGVPSVDARDAADGADAFDPGPPCDGVPGALDTTFGDNGFVVLRDAGGTDPAAVAIQQDGKIVVAGSRPGATTSVPGGVNTVFRLSSDGALDTTFGTNGVVTSSIGNFFAGGVRAVSLQADGKVVVAGRMGLSTRGVLPFLSRYLPDGRPDGTFGASGTTVTDFPGRDDRVEAMAIQADGRIVVGGETGWSTTEVFLTDHLVLRYTRDGALDPTFANGGRFTHDTRGTRDVINGIALSGDKIVASGSTLRGVDQLSFNDLSVLRLNADGTLDTTFGTLGVFTSAFGPGGNVFPGNMSFGVAVGPDGKAVSAGINGVDLGVYRLTPSGAADMTFGDGGVVATAFPKWPSAYGATVLLQRDGKVVVPVGVVSSEFNTSASGIARYLTSGALDVGFGVAGLVWTDAPPLTDHAYIHSAVASRCRLVVVARVEYTVAGRKAEAAGIARYHL